MTAIKTWLNSRTGRLVQHDFIVAVIAGATTFQAAGSSYTWGGAAAAGAVVLRVFLRQVLPVPGRTTEPAPALGQGAAHRLHLLPDPDRPLLGRLPKVFDARDVPLSRYRLTTAWPKVASCDWSTTVATYYMLLNDQLGDCTIAALLDMIQTWCAAVGNLFLPTNTLALTYYEEIDGYVAGDPSTDRGGALAKVVKWWRSKGVAGHTIAGYVTVDLTNRAEVEYAIATFGGIYTGVQLTPDNYQKQGVHWTCTSGAGGVPSSQLGHCIYVCGKTSEHVKMVTWAQKGYMTWACFERIADEAIAIVSPDFIKATGVNPNGVALSAMLADLAAFGSSSELGLAA